MSRLTVFAPGLFAELLEQSLGHIDGARWPALAMLLARASEQPLASDALEPNLVTLFGSGAGESLSLTDLTASIDCEDKPRPGLMRADPVHLRAEPNHILLFNDPSVMPSAIEADAMLETLNQGLPELGLFRGNNPARWYFRPNVAGFAGTAPPSGVNGRSITNYLPRNQRAQAFVQLMNEAQMLLHDAPSNIERETQGISPINSIWIWGLELTQSATGNAPDIVVGDDVLTAALAQQFDIEWRAEHSATEILSKIAVSDVDALVVIGSPTGSLTRDRPTISVDDFEKTWGISILHSLRRFRLNEFILVTDQQSFSLTPWSLFKLWRNRYSTSEPPA
jgi:hypothetical protein